MRDEREVTRVLNENEFLPGRLRYLKVFHRYRRGRDHIFLALDHEERHLDRTGCRW